MLRMTLHGQPKDHYEVTVDGTMQKPWGWLWMLFLFLVIGLVVAIPNNLSLNRL